MSFDAVPRLTAVASLSAVRSVNVRSLLCLLLLLIGLSLGSRRASAQLLKRIITEKVDNPNSIYAADLDGDGDNDVVSGSTLNDKIAWYENLGDAAFSDQKVITTNAEGPSSVFVKDLNGDSEPDILSASYNDDRIAWYPNDGGGSFPDQITVTTDAVLATSVYAADLDGDGDTDILSCSSGRFAGTVSWYENEGGGSFSSQKTIDTARSMRSVVASDLDGDGDADVVVAASESDEVGWYENTGGASFSDRMTIAPDAVEAQSVFATDLDGDGDTDVLSGSAGNGRVAWHENDGSGGFTTHTITTSAQGVESVYATDLDGDNDPDVLSASFNDDKIAWYENEDGSFSDQNVLSADVRNALDVFARDLDEDGHTDILFSSEYDDHVGWFKNTNSILPVEVASFDGVQVDQSSVRLIWTTASETENAGFRLQQKRAGADSWSTIDFVQSKAAGLTTTERHSYRYTAKNLSMGRYKFRLRQVDMDGSTSLTEPISVDLQMDQALHLTAPSPHPVQEGAAVSFSVREAVPARLTLYNVLGQPVHTVYEGTPTAEESHRLQLEASALPSGTYILRLEAAGRTTSRRVTVVR